MANAVEQTFVELTPLLHRLVKIALRKYRQRDNMKGIVQHDYEEAFSIAQEGFFIAYESYDSSRGTLFMTHVFNVVRDKLQKKMWHEGISHELYLLKKRQKKEEYRRRYCPGKIDMERLFLESSEDAVTMLNLLIKPNEYIKDLLNFRITRKTDKAKILIRLNKYLKWDGPRLVNTFKEIRGTLSTCLKKYQSEKEGSIA